MVNCKNCGAQCPDQATFCTQCGTTMTDTANATQNQPQNVPTTPAYEAPAAPAYEAPVAPAYEAPAAPAYEAPAAPVYETPAAPVYGATPTYEAPTAAPYAYAPPVAPTGSKAPAIVGMIFGICGLILAIYLLVVISGLNSIHGDYYGYYGSYYDYSDEMVGAFIGFSIFIIPSLIVGLITSFKAKAGKGMAIAGKITSFIALGITTISFFITLAAC